MFGLFWISQQQCDKHSRHNSIRWYVMCSNCHQIHYRKRHLNNLLPEILCRPANNATTWLFATRVTKSSICKRIKIIVIAKSVCRILCTFRLILYFSFHFSSSIKIASTSVRKWKYKPNYFRRMVFFCLFFLILSFQKDVLFKQMQQLTS